MSKNVQLNIRVTEAVFKDLLETAQKYRKLHPDSCFTEKWRDSSIFRSWMLEGCEAMKRKYTEKMKAGELL